MAIPMQVLSSYDVAKRPSRSARPGSLIVVSQLSVTFEYDEREAGERPFGRTMTRSNSQYCPKSVSNWSTSLGESSGTAGDGLNCHVHVQHAPASRTRLPSLKSKQFGPLAWIWRDAAPHN